MDKEQENIETQFTDIYGEVRDGEDGFLEVIDDNNINNAPTESDGEVLRQERGGDYTTRT